VSIASAIEFLGAAPSQQETNLLRYRAEYVCRKLHRVTAGRAHWSVLGTHDRYDGSTIESPKGGVGKGARYLYIPVDAEASLNIAKHSVMLWQMDLQQVFETLRSDESDAWQDKMLTTRWNAIWRLYRTRKLISPAPETSDALARASVKIAWVVKLAKTAP
jgi:hypothetical protein